MFFKYFNLKFVWAYRLLDFPFAHGDLVEILKLESHRFPFRNELKREYIHNIQGICVASVWVASFTAKHNLLPCSWHLTRTLSHRSPSPDPIHTLVSFISWSHPKPDSIQQLMISSISWSHPSLDHNWTIWNQQKQFESVTFEVHRTIVNKGIIMISWNGCSGESLWKLCGAFWKMLAEGGEEEQTWHLHSQTEECVAACSPHRQ